MLPTERVFSVDGEEYGWCDVIADATRNGAWANAERRARLGAASVEHAAATNNILDPTVLVAMARDFRYAHDLVTAESMERWLSDWHLTAKDWTAHLRRKANHSRWTDDADLLLERYSIDANDAMRLTLCDVICSGELVEWKQSLAGRIAAVSSLGISTMNGASDDVDDAFDRFRSAQLTDAAVRDFVGKRQLDWVQFDCRVLSFSDENMAAEAALLVREDGEAFTGVHAVASIEPRDARFVLEDVPAPVRDAFLAAQRGDLLGPMRLGNEYTLYQIREKVLPSTRDAAVRRRAEEGVLQHALRQQVDRRVRWLADLR